ncbi:MAG: transporter [Bacteroidetes bacterium]|nr:transporter [Bacteroidota bacterium]
MWLFVFHLTQSSCTRVATYTNRPPRPNRNQLFGACGAFSIEMGFNYEQVTASVTNFVVPTVLWKYGVNSNFELRAITELISSNTSKRNQTGLNPLGVGFKAKLSEAKGWVPMTSFIGHIYIPQTATPEFATNSFASDFRFTLQHALTPKLNIGYNLGAEWDGNSSEATFIYTLTTAYSFNDFLGGYIEVFGFVPDQSKASHLVDGGLTFLLTRDMQLDISGGYKLSDNAPDFYGSLGFSMRLPR